MRKRTVPSKAQKVLPPIEQTLFVVLASTESLLEPFRRLLERHPEVRCERNWISGKLTPATENLFRERYAVFQGQDFETVTCGHLLDCYRVTADEQVKAVGMCLDYETLLKKESLDWLEFESRRGGFCVLDIRDNPCEAFADERSSLECYGDCQSLVDHCRQQLAVERKIDRQCTDRLRIDFQPDVQNLSQVERACFRFLGLKTNWPGRTPVAVYTCELCDALLQSRKRRRWGHLHQVFPRDLLECIPK